MAANRASRKRRGKAAAVLRAVPAPIRAPVPTQPKVEAEELFDPSSSVWRRRVGPAFLLVLVTCALYIQVIHDPFTNYDDGEYVQQNPWIQHGITLPMLRWAFTSVEHANWHPVTWISHALDWQLFGQSPAGHHVMSVVLHIVCVVLLFIVLAEMTGSTVKSLLVALLFATHPVSVESVAWIAERKNVLCTLFFLAALLAYVGYARRPCLRSYLIVALLFALSLASKAMTVTFPFVLLLLDFWPLQRIKGWTKPSANPANPQFMFHKLILEKLPFLILSAADSIVTIVAQREALQEAAKFGHLLRVENAVVSYAGYLWNALWPTRLSILYPYPSSGLPTWRIVASAVILVACSFVVWRDRSHGYLITGWCWFLGTLVPVIGLVQVGQQAMADRYAYLPLIGIYLVVVWGLFDLARRVRPELRRFMAAAGVLAFTCLAVAAWGQVGVWRSNVSLWKQAASVTQSNPGAEDVLGDALLEDALGHGAHYSDEALSHFQKALRIDPHDSRALFSIGVDSRGRGRASEAIENYELALEYAAKDNTAEDRAMRSQILSGIAFCYEIRGDFITARQYYQQAMKVSPGGDSDLFAGLARTFTDEQIVKAADALARTPSAEGYWRLGQLQEAVARINDAQNSYRRALQLDPSFGPARTALARNGDSRRLSR